MTILSISLTRWLFKVQDIRVMNNFQGLGSHELFFTVHVVKRAYLS